MHCPFCSHTDTKVIDSRYLSTGNQTRRRRECLNCHERFTTFERAELALPAIVKQNGNREAFNEHKLRRGIECALEKRPVSHEQVETLLADIKHKLRASGEREFDSHALGEWVMNGLRTLDQVAYVRFASVYRCFQDISEFQTEIERIHQSSDELSAAEIQSDDS